MKNFVQISALCCLHKTLERQMDYLSHTYAHLTFAAVVVSSRTKAVEVVN